MRFLFLENIYGYNMTGIMGKNAEWFLGFSKALKKSDGYWISTEDAMPNHNQRVMVKVNPDVSYRILDVAVYIDSYKNCFNSVDGVTVYPTVDIMYWTPLDSLH